MQRMTRQRIAILDDLNANADFRSAQQIHADLAAKGQRIGLTTVYRSLQTLEREGLIDSVRADDGEVLFRRCRQERHHHHLVCRYCGNAVEIDLHQIEELIGQAASAHHYSHPTHLLEIYGTCPQCTEGRADSSTKPME